MKKIKLFALAAFAMLSINAFAAVGDELATTVYRYKVLTEPAASPGTAEIIGYVANYPKASMATTVIPATLDHPTLDYKYKVTQIAATAFAGNENITAVDFSAAENLTTIAAAAFEGTPITSLDLTGTKVTALNQLFETVGCQVTEIILPATLTSIEANAFEGLTKLTTINFDACEKGITIKANAFKNAMKITSFTVPEQVVALNNGVFTGSYITSLTINATDDSFAALAVGEGGTAGLGATKITSLTVNGANLTIAAKAFADAEKLATVAFNDDLATGAVATGAFAKTGTQKITVTYSPADDAADDAFAKDAFSSGATDATYVTFTTTETYGAAIEASLGWKPAGDTYGVKLSYEVTPLTIDVYNNGGSFAYGGFTVPAAYANGIKIAKKQGEANVMVYGAYFDNIGGKGTNSAVMMDQLHLIGGYYYLPTGTKFIVKSSSEDKVVFTAMDATEKTKYDSRHLNPIDNKDRNEIQAYAGPADCYANSLFGAGKVIYFLRDLKGGKEFGWKQREDDAVISAGQLYLEFIGTAAARIDVVWLDGSEEDATAIKAVKTAAEKGAIYNLAGQKVNAAYKGVVIKDGKKYIQK